MKRKTDFALLSIFVFFLTFFTRCDCWRRNFTPESVAPKVEKDHQKVKEALQQAFSEKKRQLEQQLYDLAAKCTAHYSKLSTCLLKHQACTTPNQQAEQKREASSLRQQAQEQQLKGLQNEEQQLRKQLEDLENQGQKLQHNLQQLHQKHQQDLKNID